ncbi:MAG: hypothetical protein FJZ96_13455 [Chloroflexi bacterium]|nr:hypothetical protein [Chloroflexota bacterium]
MKNLILSYLVRFCILSVLVTGCTIIESVSTTPSPSNTPTLVAEPSATPKTPSPTASPQATLSPEEAQEFIINLLETNGGCELPCLWGIYPGVSTVAETTAFFRVFTPEFYFTESGFAVFMDLPEYLTPDVAAINFFTSKGMISHILSYSIQGAGIFQLPFILTHYGQPEEVWVQTFSPNLGESRVSFSVIAFYGKQGFAADWQGSGIVVGKMIHGCINNQPSLNTWFPSPDISTISDTSRLFDPILPGGSLRLLEASGMDEVTFYESFKDVQGAVCLDTPMNLWLGVYGQTPSP